MLANSGHQTTDALPSTVRNLRTQLAELTRTLGHMERALERQYAPPKPQVTRATSTQPKAGFGYVLFDQAFSARNGNEVLVSVLRHFAELDPEFPERFSQVVRTLGRKRPYVARSADMVYPGKPQLSSFTESFAPGWYVGTNESNDKKRALLRVACQALGFRFGKDLKVRM